jgi:hypothetical protein
VHRRRGAIPGPRCQSVELELFEPLQRCRHLAGRSLTVGDSSWHPEARQRMLLEGCGWTEVMMPEGGDGLLCVGGMNAEGELGRVAADGMAAESMV